MDDYTIGYEKYRNKYNQLIEAYGGKAVVSEKLQKKLDACRDVLENNKILERRPGKTYMKLSKEMYETECKE
tara:strand:+ start:1094 stop:1309 length:216 start_codon:yes stop_codon:yes gene_type:complete